MTGDQTPYPFLALVLFEDSECTLLRNQALTDVVPPAVFQRLGRPAGIRCDAVEADQQLLRDILPMPDELRLLTHVRQVNVDDRELSAGDSDGYFAVVMGNRIPRPGGSYVACLVSVEERTDLLPTTDLVGRRRLADLGERGDRAHLRAERASRRIARHPGHAAAQADRAAHPRRPAVPAAAAPADGRRAAAQPRSRAGAGGAGGQPAGRGHGASRSAGASRAARHRGRRAAPARPAGAAAQLDVHVRGRRHLPPADAGPRRRDDRATPTRPPGSRSPTPGTSWSTSPTGSALRAVLVPRAAGLAAADPRPARAVPQRRPGAPGGGRDRGREHLLRRARSRSDACSPRPMPGSRRS